MNIGAKVRNLRNRDGLTQKALGERLGYSESFISYVEKDLRNINPQDLGKLAEIFKVPRTYFLQDATTVVNFRADTSNGQSEYDISDFIRYARRKVNESKK